MENIERFINAQHSSFDQALAEVKNGKKQSHWMWYIFPQIQGLALSETSRFYAIKDIREAEDFLNHPILGSRLILISNELLKIPGNDATKIFGNPDDLKLKSSMTLFASLTHSNPVFQSVLDKFYNGTKDSKTLQLIQ